MKKIIKLTEADLTKLIKRVIAESSKQKMDVLKANISKTKNSECWKKGMCPKVVAGDVSQTECEFCVGPIAGILVPAVGVITGAILGIRNHREKKQRKEQEEQWIEENPELMGRVFTYFTDGSVQARKGNSQEDIMIKTKEGSWTKL